MPTLPRDRWPDASLPMMLDPYRYISRRARQLRSNAFRTRLMGRRAVCLTGPEAAAFFYAPGRTSRVGAAPQPIADVIFGRGGIQQLDGARHLHRKALFLALLQGEPLDRLVLSLEEAWDAAAGDWAGADSIDVFEETSQMLAAAVCAWAGVPVERRALPEVARMLRSLFLHAADFSPSYLRGRTNRARADRWARGAVLQARQDRVAGRADPVAQVAGWKEIDGNPIPADVAAVELLSVLRTTVAMSVYFTFVAMALHRHPEHRRRVAADDRHAHAFVQEVRRLYPFFPVIGALATEELSWSGARIPAETRLVLDLYGTCRDPHAWDQADRFQPERFLDWPGDPWTMIPQGGGDHASTHRCAGEWVTIRLMEVRARRLARARYEVLTPDAVPNYRALPALPKGGFRLGGFRPG